MHKVAKKFIHSNIQTLPVVDDAGFRKLMKEAGSTIRNNIIYHYYFTLHVVQFDLDSKSLYISKCTGYSWYVRAKPLIVQQISVVSCPRNPIAASTRLGRLCSFAITTYYSSVTTSFPQKLKRHALLLNNIKQQPCAKRQRLLRMSVYNTVMSQ